LKSQHPEIKVYYFISKNSADYTKVRSNAVEYGSLKSFWLLANCRKIVSTHYALVCPNMTPKLFKLCGLHKKFYFLQHGVIPNKLKFLYYENAPMRLFVCGAKPEFDFVNETFEHPQNVVRYTGLARYDNLHNIQTKKQILIMPTWRSFIRSESDLLNSSYYREWNSLLNDVNLKEVLENSGAKLIFYPHYEIQKYLGLFNTKCDSVILASFKDYDVQTLLKESALLITDYSSVFFDFAYMRKPVLYFHFDKEEFYGKHYEEGYFNYEQIGFGEVSHNVYKVVDNIIYKIKNDFYVEPFYEKRMKAFFPLRDTKNCERIFDAILES